MRIKTLNLAFTCILIITLTGCHPAGTEFTAFIVTDDLSENHDLNVDANSISLVLQNVSSKGATFIINNEADQIQTYGEDYSLQQMINNTWEDVPYMIEHAGFNDIGYELPPESITQKITIDWMWLYGELPDGQYRLTKTVSGEDGIIQIQAEFELINGEEIKPSHYIITVLDDQDTAIAEKEITDKTSMEIVSKAIMNVMIKSTGYEIDTSSVTTFYKITTVYSNEETSDMTFYEVDGKAYGNGFPCDYEMYQLMIGLVN